MKKIIKKNITIFAVMALIALGVALTISDSFLYLWLHSPITLAAIWIAGFMIEYFYSFLLCLRKKVYRLDNGEYKKLAQVFMQKSGLTLHQLIIKQSRKTNAQAVGFGNRRAIVLNSALCQELPPEQLEAVLAHEVGHHAHHDILIGTVLGATVLDLLALASVFFTHELRGGIGTLLIIDCVFAVVALMAGTMYSRYREGRADEFATKFIGEPQYLSQALETMLSNFIKKQGWTIKQKLPLWVRLFTTHPSIYKRIDDFKA